MKFAYKEKYPHLFAPLEVGKGLGKMTLRNRALVTPMGCLFGVDSEGYINERFVEFYSDFIRGGAASVEIPLPIPRNASSARSAFLDDEENIPIMDMHYLQRVVHAYGGKTFCEIFHPGCCMIPSPAEGRVPMSASAMTWNGGFVKEMNEDDMHQVAELYARNAFMAQRAGFDALNLHFAHGWLMSNFLSPLSNKRKDQYGGSVENRCRFPVMVLKKIREYIGDMVIELRLNGSDGVEGGIEKEDAAEQVQIFQEYVDMIHITCGNRLDAMSRPLMHPTHYLEPGHNAEASEYVKKRGAKIPIGVVGSVHSADLAEEIIASGKADYILAGRQFLADPHWINKVKEDRQEDIRPCLRCDTCLDSGRRGALTTNLTIANNASFDCYCAVNPWYGQSMMKKIIAPSGKVKKVAIIGGGIAGMQAALTANERGHKVTLFEKEAKLGGQLNIFADKIWFKTEVRALREHMIIQIAKKDIEVRLNTCATPEDIEKEGFDAVIVAVGAEPIRAKIKGSDKENVIIAHDFYDSADNQAKTDILGKNVVIVGGGLIGCEVSLLLGEQGYNVTVVEMDKFLVKTAPLSERMHLLKFMEENNVKHYLETTCKEITDEGVVIVQKDGSELVLPADSVILSIGTKALAQERDKFADVAFEVTNIGDCVRSADIRHAIHSAFDAAWVL